MYGIVVMVALSSSAQIADCVGWGCASEYGGGYGGWDLCPYCPPRCGCGRVVPAQVGWGTGVPQVSAAEQKRWDDYVASLDNVDDRQAVSDLWTRADLGARRQLLTKIPPPVKLDEDSTEKEKELPKPEKIKPEKTKPEKN
jgi:hypothetical protein